MIRPQEITEVFNQVMLWFEGKLDHVILCHGKICDADIFEANVSDFDQIMRVNVRSAMHLASLSLPYLKHSGPFNHPSITILTSSQGVSPDD